MARTSAGSHRTLYFFARQSVRLWVGAFLLWCGGVLAFISGASLLDERRYRDAARTARDVRRKLRLSRHGTPAEATVLSVEATNVRINRKPQWRIRFRYRDRAGEEREGTSGYLPASQAHEWKRGDVGRVHIDPDGQDQALWIGEPPAPA